MPAAIFKRTRAFIYIFIKINSIEVIFDEFMLGFVCYFFFLSIHTATTWDETCFSQNNERFCDETSQKFLRLVRKTTEFKIHFQRPFYYLWNHKFIEYFMFSLQLLLGIHTSMFSLYVHLHFTGVVQGLLRLRDRSFPRKS